MSKQLQLLHKAIPQYSVRLVRDRWTDGPRITGPSAAASVAVEFLRDHDREVFAAIFVSSSNRVTGINVCHIGTLNASLVRIADVFKAAILANAASVVFTHNHPSGNPEPSREDISMTRKLVEAGKLLDIRVLDHLIVTSNGDYTSLSERGFLS